MAKTTNYSFELKKCVSERESVYKKIFNQFGHTGSLMEYKLFSDLGDNEKQELCNLVFMVDKESAHLLFPMVKNDIVSDKEAAVLSIYSMKHVTDHCTKCNVAASTYIGLSETSTTAKTFGFTKAEDSQEIGGATFYEFSKPHTQTKANTQKTSVQSTKTEAPKEQ